MKTDFTTAKKLALRASVCWATLLVTHLLTAPDVAADGSRMLRLKDGSFSKGEVVPLVESDRIGWQADGFVAPFHLDVNAVRAITPSDPNFKPQAPKGVQLFELSNGGLVVGKLKSIDRDILTVASELLGELHVHTSSVVTMVDSSYAGKVLYSGPNQDTVWNSAGEPGDWLFEGGTFVAQKAGGTLVGNLGLPDKCRLNIVLSWTEGSPDFVIAIGTDENARSARAEDVASAARLEVWDRDFAFVRETESDADIKILEKLELSTKRLDLVFYIDQTAGKIIACDQHGRRLEELLVPSEKPTVRSALHLSNIGASLRLERVEVREWDGFTTSSDSEGPMLLTSEGEVPGAISGFDAATNELLVNNGQTENRLPLTSVLRAAFRPADQVPRKNDGLPAMENRPPTVPQPSALDQSGGTEQNAEQGQRTDGVEPAGEERSAGVQDIFSTTPAAKTAEPVVEEVAVQVELLLNDRSRLRGIVQAGSGETLDFAANDLVESISIAPDAVIGLIGSIDKYRRPASVGVIGTLRNASTQLSGELVDTPEGSSATNLFFKPIGAASASEISADAEGAIVYRKSAVRVTPPRPTPAPALNGIARFLNGPVTRTNVQNKPPVREIAFRTGDIIQADVESISESGVTFKSQQSTTTFAAHAQVQSVDLNQQIAATAIDDKKIQRLMTVPRSRKLDPPTHLFIAVTGDYLRGRLISYSGDTLAVEVGLELVELPAKNVAKIVWLHDREWETEEDKANEDAKMQADAPEGSDGKFWLHAIRAGDRGLTFSPMGLKAGELFGNSDLLGDCSLELSELEQLLFGRNIEQRVREFRDDPWTLALAQYPKVFLEEEDGEVPAGGGQESQLVGKPAIEFGLKQLDGGQFRLSQHRDRIVVLDFWASWCGPCIQTMPAVEEVVQEIGTDKIHLVAVNIQEPSSRVEAAVNRLEIEATVLLDVDGEVAAAYQAQAIPQTVIIDRDGNVTHLFVGGGSRFVKQFRAALEGLVGATDTQ